MKRDLPQTAADRLAFLDAHRVYMQFDDGPLNGFYIARVRNGWKVGKGVDERTEPTLQEAIDAIMENRAMDPFGEGESSNSNTDPEWD